MRGRGSTLVELCVVVAVLAIVSVMTVTFSVFTSNYVKKTQHQYSFMEEVATLKDEMTAWIYSVDEASIKISVNDGHILASDGRAVIFNGEAQTVTLDGARVMDTGAVDELTFESFGNGLIKCTARGSLGDSEMEQVFLLSLRCAEIPVEVADE
jgi:type II secretory pathway pseudopilin PulG